MALCAPKNPKRAMEMCIEKCLDELGVPRDRCNQSSRFLKCVAECMVNYGFNG